MIKKIHIISLVCCFVTLCCLLNMVGYTNWSTVEAEENLNNQILQDIENTYDVSITKFELLKDFEGETKFYLLEGDKSYFIINILTNSIFERSMDSNSPYFVFDNMEKVYGGYGNYFIKYDGYFYDILNNCNVYDSDITDLFQEQLNEICIADIENSQNRITVQSRWGKNDHYASDVAENYFSTILDCDEFQEVDVLDSNTNEGFTLYNPSLPGGSYIDKDKVAIGVKRVEQGLLLDKYYLNYDLKIPDNDGTSCGIVAMVMALQYYSRTGIGNTIPQSFIQSKSNVITYNPVLTTTRSGGAHATYQPNKVDYLAYHLWGTLDSLTPAGIISSANSYINLRDGINAFYTQYPRTSDDLQLQFHANACYDNMMGCIDGGDLALGMTGLVGNGYYQVEQTDESLEWESTSVTRHIMVAYGYCTNDDGSLADFICHSGWTMSGTSKMYVYKLNFLGNVTIERG